MSWAHPRSRGENEESASDIVRTVGSSPLTRGKPHHLGCDVSDPGLIPAHAGKTIGGSLSSLPMTAHPRSRGENGDGQAVCPACVGSSPLTRGKHIDGVAGGPCLGLIPAHAGKTLRAVTLVFYHSAHPRSRGENTTFEPSRRWGIGSSPLTRGKPNFESTYAELRGLIPAHAGKTPGRHRRP